MLENFQKFTCIFVVHGAHAVKILSVDAMISVKQCDVSGFTISIQTIYPTFLQANAAEGKR